MLKRPTSNRFWQNEVSSLRTCKLQYPVCGSSRGLRSMSVSLKTRYSNLNVLVNAGTLPWHACRCPLTAFTSVPQQGYYFRRVSRSIKPQKKVRGAPPPPGGGGGGGGGGGNKKKYQFGLLMGRRKATNPFFLGRSVNHQGTERTHQANLTNWSPKDKGSQSFTGVRRNRSDSDHAERGWPPIRAIEILDRVKRHRSSWRSIRASSLPLVAPKKYFRHLPTR